MAPKRAFGGVLRPFGGGFRGPNRERASVFSGAGRGRAGGSAVEPGRDQRVQRRGIGRCRWFCGGARGTKKRTSVRSLLFLLHYSATLRASAPGCSSDTPCRTTTAPHSGSPSLLRETSGSMFSCNSLSAFDFGLPVGRGHSRESLRPPPGSQFSAARVTVLSRPGSRPSAARNLPSLLLAPSAAGVTAPPRQYGRPPATGESPASSLRRASPARDSTAYRPAP